MRRRRISRMWLGCRTGLLPTAVLAACVLAAPGVARASPLLAGGVGCAPLLAPGTTEPAAARRTAILGGARLVFTLHACPRARAPAVQVTRFPRGAARGWTAQGPRRAT